MMSATDVDVVKRADPTPDTQEIWIEFGDRLRRFIARRVESEADVDDMLQDIFLRIHLHLSAVQRGDRLISWLYQITRNAIADYYRAPERRRIYLAGIPLDIELEPNRAIGELDPPGDDPASAFRELAGCLSPMVSRLAPHYREAVTLIDLQGIPQQDAAARAGISLSGMKSRVQRGRKELTKLMHACCHLERDAGGRVIDYQLRGAECSQCDGARAQCGSVLS